MRDNPSHCSTNDVHGGTEVSHIPSHQVTRAHARAPAHARPRHCYAHMRIHKKYALPHTFTYIRTDIQTQKYALTGINSYMHKDIHAHTHTQSTRLPIAMSHLPQHLSLNTSPPLSSLSRHVRTFRTVAIELTVRTAFVCVFFSARELGGATCEIY